MSTTAGVIQLSTKGKGGRVRLVERTIDLADLGTISQEQQSVRSAGLHVSQIIRYMSERAGLKKSNTFTRDDLDKFALVGRLWEELLARTLFPAPRYQRPGEITVDGITGSPDCIDTDSETVMEFKVTWRSVPPDIRDFMEYFWQIKAYCWMLEIPFAQLWVLFVCGNWRPPVPVAKAWDIEFTSQELYENWMQLKANAKDAAAWTK